MSKFKCNCGHVLDLVRSPAKEELVLIPLLLLEELGGSIEKKEMSEDSFFGSIQDGSRDVLECPQCARLWVQASEKGFVSFIREEPDS